MEAMKLKLRTYRLGTKRKPGQGLRMGVVRFLPRGVRKKDYSRLDYFDVWFPLVAPSPKLVKKASTDFAKFAVGYEKEMETNPSAAHSIKLLALVAKKTPLSIGCYCEDESLCHRSILKKLIEKEAKPISS